MSRYLNSVPQIIDGNGDPIVGAKKAMYTPGTTNLKTIYSDSALATPRTNPVTSDSDGRFPEFFLDGLYDEVQQDASGTVDTDDGVTIWTRDNVGDVSTGPFELWDSGTIYSIPQIALGSDDEYYRSLVDSNQGNDPTSSAVQWEQLRLGRIWNTNATYSTGESAYGSDGFLYISRTNSNSGNNPTTDEINWFPDAAKVLLETLTASASPSLDFTAGIDSTYKIYEIEFINIVPVSASDLYLRFSDDAGSTWKAGASDYTYSAGISASFIPLSTVATTISNTAAHGGACGNVLIYNPSDAALWTSSITAASTINGVGSLFMHNSAAVHEAALAIDGFQILMSIGNIASGVVNLYGIRK